MWSEYTFLFFERSAVLLVAVFAFTRLPGLRRRFGTGPAAGLWNLAVFAVIAVAGTLLGVDFIPGQVNPVPWRWHPAGGAVRVGPELVAVVIAGLAGGPAVGAGVGALAGTAGALARGAAPVASFLAQTLAGLLAGGCSRAFHHEGVLSPEKAVFVGMFAPVLFCGMLLIFPGATPVEDMIQLVDRIGLPLVISDSLAIGLFSAIVRVAMQEAERTAALQMQRALRIAEQALSPVRWRLTESAAQALAAWLQRELPAAAVAITDLHRTLAHVGAGADHHGAEGEALAPVVRRALQQGEITMSESAPTLCPRRGCPLRGAMVVPFQRMGRPAGAIVLYTHHPHQLRAVDSELARGLGRLISRELDLGAVEELRRMAQEARLRALQAQIHPHFLFNTLQLITGLIRQDPALARQMVLRLAQFLRHSVESSRRLLVPLEDDIQHARAYADIVETRFRGRLQIVWEIDPAVPPALVPPCTLQPLLENSVRHGLGAQGLGGRVQVRVTRERDAVRVEVTDDGPGFPREMLSAQGNPELGHPGGVGMAIVRERLEALFGPGHTLHLENAEPHGARVWFTLPAGAAGVSEVRA